MKKYNAQLIFSILFFILISSNLYSQETKFDIVGFWNSVDISENQSKTIFSQDEYVTMTINGEEIDGRKFIIRGGTNNGQKAELKYKVDYNENPIHIDLIAIKDNQERGRILGIITPINKNKFLMAISFDGKRPQKIDENSEHTLTLTKSE
ncbi:MAG: hypothetical protein KA796_11350 [Chryseobacterium sp.]|nr:hypothetical protein [Chryseobacterium sp.]